MIAYPFPQWLLSYSYTLGLSRMICLAAIATTLFCEARAQTPTGLQLLGRGINYGNMLEAPSEGDWGLRFEDDYPKLIKSAGFDSVRLPVRWSAHASSQSPYTIDPDFLARVKHIVKLSIDQDLKVVLNVHHYEEIFKNPAEHSQRLIALWKQIAEAFKDADSRLFFELLNEPHDQLTAELWNDLLVEAIKAVRPHHPQRWLIVGPDHWNNVHTLPQLKLPEEDRRIIVTVHYYLPFAFTHQGASWVDPPPPVGTEWSGSDSQVAEISEHLAQVAAWASEHQRPIYVGEFGAFEQADMQSRIRWTRALRQQCEDRGFAWAYWELAAGFGVLDPQSLRWKQGLLQALVGQ